MCTHYMFSVHYVFWIGLCSSYSNLWCLWQTCTLGVKTVQWSDITNTALLLLHHSFQEWLNLFLLIITLCDIFADIYFPINIHCNLLIRNLHVILFFFIQDEEEEIKLEINVLKKVNNSLSCNHRLTISNINTLIVLLYCYNKLNHRYSTLIVFH